jgi:hypothetical protein
MGKSWSLSADVDAYIQQSPDTAIIRLDLLSFCSEDRLYRALFEDDVFARWVESDSDLHLYIDSLDECILRIDSVAAVFADEIPKYPLKQLKLRFACRTAPWPTLLEKALKNGFGEEHFAAAELVPLRRVRGAALKAIYLGEKYDDAMWSYLEHPGSGALSRFVQFLLNVLSPAQGERGQLSSCATVVREAATGGARTYS